MPPWVSLFALPGVGASYWSGFLPAVVVLGFGMTVMVAPLTTTVMNAVGPDLAGVASGVNNAVSRAAAVLAIAVFGAIMAWAFDAALAERLQAMGASDEVRAFLAAERDRLAAAGAPPGADAATVAAVKRAVAESFVAGFRWVMLLSAGLAVLSAVSAWLMIRRTPVEKPDNDKP